LKLSSHDTSNQFDPTSSIAEHPGLGAVADGLALMPSTSRRCNLQLTSRRKVSRAEQHSRTGAEQHSRTGQRRRQDSGGGGAHVTPELIDLDGPMMELVGVDPLLNIAIIFYPVSWTTTYN